jgi:phage/plasmid primase-like uncharacterized protein
MKAEEVKMMAAGRWIDILAAIAPQLKPALERPGRHGPCPVHGGKDGFRVFRDVADTGGSICNTCGVFADGFATLMWSNKWDFLSALNAVEEFLGGGARIVPAPKPVAAPREQPSTSDDDKLRRALNRMWKEAVPVTDRQAEPVRLYLASRGLAGMTLPSEVIRFHPSLSYYEDGKEIGRFPALVAMVVNKEGRPVTIHRTFLTKDGQKAPVESPKKLMPYPKDRKIVGGAIRLAQPGNVLAVAEGLETALAVMKGAGLPTWCAVNASLMERLDVPRGVRRVIVFADKDRPTEQHPEGHGQEAAKALAQRLWASGVAASTIIPDGEIPPGQKSLDWADVLQKDGKAGFLAMLSRETFVRRAA